MDCSFTLSFKQIRLWQQRCCARTDSIYRKTVLKKYPPRSLAASSKYRRCWLWFMQISCRDTDVPQTDN